jgi:hypothetical protein
MALSRRALFGFPPPQPPSSVHTVRLVPLTQGVNQDTAWPLQVPGSATSMVNFLPLDGTLVPRSRLSSLNTIRAPGGSFGAISGLYEMHSATFASAPITWYSTATGHGLVSSDGSLSFGSFVSAAGLGIGSGLLSRTHWQYATAFGENINDNIVVAAGLGSGPSVDTLLVLYREGGNGAPMYSYLTGAPKAYAVGAFDSYILAWGIEDAVNRIQWCVRGSPSNWTGEGSGFEDLLAMRGVATRVVPMANGRVVLMTNRETWYGVTATYPAQFYFHPLDPNVGCPFPLTVQYAEEGVLFLGSDHALRLLPYGGGKPEIVVPGLAPLLRRLYLGTTNENAHAIYDPSTKLYYLFVQRNSTVGAEDDVVGLVINTRTGEWGRYTPGSGIGNLSVGLAQSQDRASTGNISEGILVVSLATIYSFNSLLGTDSGQAVTSTWQSTPIAADLAGGWKQLTEINVDYRATSASTLTIRVAADGNTYESTGRSLSLASAPVAGRAQSQVYAGGPFPVIEITSSSTGYALHRMDVGMNIGGRRS